ncbi:MAG: TetR/AcrR family transcriptional regulator [Betaproteobacteria bacterium]
MAATTPRQKIDRAAYDLFTRHGIRAVGVDTIVARAGVAKMTLYRHYASKDELALAFFRRRWDLFSRGWQIAVAELGLPPRQALLGVFDEWMRAPGYSGCPVVKAILETEHERGPGARRRAALLPGRTRFPAAAGGVRDPKPSLRNGICSAGERSSRPRPASAVQREARKRSRLRC